MVVFGIGTSVEVVTAEEMGGSHSWDSGLVDYLEYIYIYMYAVTAFKESQIEGVGRESN